MRVRVRDSLQPDGAVGYWTAHPLLRSETSTRNQTKYATTPHGHVMEGARSSRCRHVNSATRYIHSAITDRLRFWKTSFAHLVLPTLFCDKRDTPLARPVPDARRCARAFPLVPSHICVAQRLARRVCHPRRSHAMGAARVVDARTARSHRPRGPHGLSGTTRAGGPLLPSWVRGDWSGVRSELHLL